MVMPILAVADTAASIKFYEEGLGFAVTMSMPGENDTISFAIVNLGHINIGLSLQALDQPKGLGCVLMVYPPEDYDIDAHYEDVKSKGIPIDLELKAEYWGDKLFGVKDPDGYVLHFCKTYKEMTPDEIIAEAAKA